jgi:hypothetical protein
MAADAHRFFVTIAIDVIHFVGATVSAVAPPICTVLKQR